MKTPSFGSKTEVVIPLKKEAEDETSNQWSAAVVRQGEKNIYVSVSDPHLFAFTHGSNLMSFIIHNL